MDIIDVKTIFIVQNARVVAEDIIGNIQINLVEKTKGKDYIEVIRPQFLDILTQDDFGMKSMDKSHGDHDSITTDAPGKSHLQIEVNDDLLRGVTNFKSRGAKQLKEMGTKTAMAME